MKKSAVLLILALLSMKGSAQNSEYLYTNASYGVEVKFPSTPIISGNKNSRSEQPSATLNIAVDGGLTYQILIQRNNALVNYVTLFKNLGGFVICKYDVGKIDVTEMELQRHGVCYRYKIVKSGGSNLLLYVSSQTCASDKDILPFFNSLKINGTLIQNPNTDNSKFTNFAIDYPSKAKTDTITKIVYLNSDTKGNYNFEKLSDIDNNIPKNASTNPYRFALIIGNEDYSSHQLDLSSEINVDFARNDAAAFQEYAINTLGIPNSNLIFLLDATTGQMNQGISKLNLIIKNTRGNAEVIVYFAGHGLPDEQTKEAYLIPVDVSGKNANEGIPLKLLYSKLTEYPALRITVFIDACFSGGARNQGLLAARGVKMNPKEELLSGNLVVFSASSGEQSSLPLKEKHHGIFTYYLLKKIQETKGDVNYGELSKSIIENVSLQSVLINDKEQSPQVNVSNAIQIIWENYNMK